MDNLKELEERMLKTLDFTRKDFAGIRTGRATPAILDRIMVSVYGQMMPIKQAATIAVPDPRTLTIQPWDRSIAGELEKALQKADLGINPINDGKSIRLSFPTLTEERRGDLVKMLKKRGEEAKVALRNLRREVMDKIKKDKATPEDEIKRLEEKIQKLTDKYISEVEKAIELKEKEIMEV